MTVSSGFDWRLWRRLYDRVLSWSSHPRAPAILFLLSFAESSFFPVPPDVMLAPMCLARTRKCWRFASICTVGSVLGGLFGYLVGRWAFTLIESWLLASSYAGVFRYGVDSFRTWGVVYILLAGFTPIPYKVFTISAGVVGMPFIPFLLGSVVGRGGRFFLVAGIIHLFGDQASDRLRSWVDIAGWTLLVITLLGFVAWWLGKAA